MWRLPLSSAHRVAGTAGKLIFVGGAGDFDQRGLIRHPQDLPAQLHGTIANIAEALAIERCELRDIVRLKVFYTNDGTRDEWMLLAGILRHFEAEPAPAVSLIPVPLQPFPGQELQVQVIAIRGWRDEKDGIRVALDDVPARYREAFGGRSITRGLRAGEFIAVPSRTAVDSDGIIPAAADGAEQSRIIMSAHDAVLKSLGASFQDCVKMEGYYFGKTLEQWAGMARMRASFFREPGPVATVVPCHVLWPEGALTKIEVMAMRETWNGFDKYIPRDDRWPRRVWDWPVPLPYRQAIRLRDTIWLGGQVPYATHSNAGLTTLPGELLPQTSFTMSYIDDLLHAFGRTPHDLQLMIGYFTSKGSEAETQAFVETVAASIPGELPPFTIVPQPHMHTDEMLVEIWGVARG
jgi:enamine deaminase RidA (YjgF/YER057c/UK114 family)